MRIFLMGFMGCGKTTIGKQVAEKLNFTFIDLDTFIEQKYQRSISSIFEKFGETYFREIEKKELKELLCFSNIVVSTGGGTPCFFDNMQIINKLGISCYLQTDIEILATRLSTAKNQRPLIKGKTHSELIEFITETLGKREEFYKQATFTIVASNLMMYAITELIVNKIEKLFVRF